MYKILTLIIISISLNSCFSSNNIIVDEGVDNINKPTDSLKNNTVVVGDRGIISRDDGDFVIEDIAGNIENQQDNHNYQFSGLSKTSSKVAIKAIQELKDSNKEISFVIYFDFDSDKINSNSMNIILMHQKFIENNPELKLFLEGHTDIKGGREYNLSLGEKRAISVKDIIGNFDITAISFGEEKTISNIDSKNRRVEFIYQ